MSENENLAKASIADLVKVAEDAITKAETVGSANTVLVFELLSLLLAKDILKDADINVLMTKLTVHAKVLEKTSSAASSAAFRDLVLQLSHVFENSTNAPN